MIMTCDRVVKASVNVTKKSPSQVEKLKPGKGLRFLHSNHLPFTNVVSLSVLGHTADISALEAAAAAACVPSRTATARISTKRSTFSEKATYSTATTATTATNNHNAIYIAAHFSWRVFSRSIMHPVLSIT